VRVERHREAGDARESLLANTSRVANTRLGRPRRPGSRGPACGGAAVAGLTRQLRTGLASLDSHTTVTWCGSTCFQDAYVEAACRPSPSGRIVLGVGLFGHEAGTATNGPLKALRHLLHLRKVAAAPLAAQLARYQAIAQYGLTIPARAPGERPRPPPSHCGRSPSEVRVLARRSGRCRSRFGEAPCRRIADLRTRLGGVVSRHGPNPSEAWASSTYTYRGTARLTVWSIASSARSARNAVVPRDASRFPGKRGRAIVDAGAARRLEASGGSGVLFRTPQS
jgi:hypothetical protein